MQTNGSAEPNRERQGERKPEGSISWVSASTATRFAGASVTCRPFRNRPLGLWWHRLRRRSQQRQLPRARRMVLGERQRTRPRFHPFEWLYYRSVPRSSRNRSLVH